MAGTYERRRRLGQSASGRVVTPPSWRPPGSSAVSPRRTAPAAHTAQTTKTPAKKTLNPTFSNSLIRAISGKRPLASHSRQMRTVEGHNNFLCLGVETLWKEASLCDVSIHVDRYTFYAHKLILCTFSDYFYDIILGEPRSTATSASPRSQNSERGRPRTSIQTIHLNDLEPMAVQNIIECLYMGKINITEDSVREILDAASFLKIKLVTKECEAYLCDNLTKENCAEMLSMATAYQLRYLEELSLKMIARNFVDVSISDHFVRLYGNHMVDIMSRDDLLVTSELDVFRAALAWLEANEPSDEVLERIFKTIRLPLLSPQEILDNVETVGFLMKNSRCQFLVKEALHYHCMPARQSILQSERTAPRACSKYTAILAIGGAPRLVHDQVNRNIDYFDPMVGRWTLLTRMPEPRHHHAVAILGGFLYVAGGEKTNDQQSPTNTAYRFDPRTDTWLQIASMNTCRESFQLVILMDTLYAIGGRLNQEESLSSVERYNPAVDEWTSVAELSSPRRSMAAATHNGRIYVMGGSGEKRISSKVERYNPLLNRWEPRRRLSAPRFFAQLAATKTKLFLVGGATVDNRGSVVGLPYVEAYNPLTDTWTRLRQILEPRAEFGLALHASRLYIIGGYSWDRQARLNSVEVYDLTQNRSEYLPGIEQPYTGIGACSLTLYHRLDGKPMYHKTDPPQLASEVVKNVNSNDKVNESYSGSGRRAVTVTRSRDAYEVHVAYSDLR